MLPSPFPAEDAGGARNLMTSCDDHPGRWSFCIRMAAVWFIFASWAECNTAPGAGLIEPAGIPNPAVRGIGKKWGGMVL